MKDQKESDRKLTKLQRSLSDNPHGVEVNIGLMNLDPGENRFIPSDTTEALGEIIASDESISSLHHIFRKTRCRRYRKFNRYHTIGEDLEGTLNLLKNFGVEVDVSVMKLEVEKSNLKTQYVSQFAITDEGAVYGRFAASHQSIGDPDFKALGYAVAAQKLNGEPFKLLVKVPSHRNGRIAWPMEAIERVDPALAARLKSRKH